MVHIHRYCGSLNILVVLISFEKSCMIVLLFFQLLQFYLNNHIWISMIEPLLLHFCWLHLNGNIYRHAWFHNASIFLFLGWFLFLTSPCTCPLRSLGVSFMNMLHAFQETVIIWSVLICSCPYAYECLIWSTPECIWLCQMTYSYPLAYDESLTSIHA